MSMKIIIVIVGAVVLTTASVIAARNYGRLNSYQLRESQQANAGEVVPPNKRLEWYAHQTKAKGENAITLNAPFIDYPGNSMSTHIDDAISASAPSSWSRLSKRLSPPTMVTFLRGTSSRSLNPCQNTTPINVLTVQRHP